MRAMIIVLFAMGCSGGNTKEPADLGGADTGVDMPVADVAVPRDVATADVTPTEDSSLPDTSTDLTVADFADITEDAGNSTLVCEPHIFTHDAKQRGYVLCAPSPVPAGPLPVILGFHGGGGNAGNWWNGVAMHGLADRGQFVMVYMQGCRDNLTDCATANGSFQWNVEKPDDPRTTNDESYTLAVVDRLSGEHGIDVGPLFAMGHSLGGMFLYTLRCDHPDLFTAIAPISGTPVDGSCNPTGDTSIYHVHGDEDPNVPFATGCCSAAQQNMASANYLAACDALPRCFNPTNWWPRVRDGQHPFADLTGLDEVASMSLDCGSTQTMAGDYPECQALDGCRAGTAVEVCLAPGAGHGLNSIEGTFDYRTYIWSRFATHL